MMVFKRIVSAITCTAVLASSMSVFSGCSMKEFFSKSGPSTASESGVITNGDWLKMVNDAFGMQVDENAEDGELDAARAWGVIGDDEEIDKNAPVDDKFVASTLTRAAGFVDKNASDADVISAAVQHGIISSPDAKVSDPQEAMKSLAQAQQSWSHPTPEEHRNIDLADNVQNFNDVMNVNDVKIEGDNINIPSTYATSLDKDAVYIVPKDDEGSGGAYKVISKKDNGDGTTSVLSVPAKLEEVYKRVDVSGVFPVDLNNFQSTNSNVTVVSNKGDEEGGIKPLGYAGEEGQIQQLGTAYLGSLMFNTKIGDFTVSAGLSEVNLTADVDWDFGWGGLDINRIFMTVDYTTAVNVEYEWGNIEDLFPNKFLEEPSIELGELPIEICPGISVKLRVVLSLEASGKISLSVQTSNSKGFEIKNGNVRAINETSHSEELGISGEAGVYVTGVVALTLDYLVGEVDLLNLELKIGPTLKGEMKEHTNTDNGEKLLCIDVSGFMKIELKLYLLKDVLEYFDMESSITLFDCDQNNSPITWFDIHIENFQFVDHCTANDAATTTTTQAVTVPVGILEIDQSYLSLAPGSTGTIGIKSMPSGYTMADLEWSSSDPSKVTVDSNGNVTAVSSGSAGITVKTKDGKNSASCVVSVKSNVAVSNNISSNVNSEAVAA